MYICKIYMLIHKHVHMHIRTYIHTYMYIHIYICIYRYIYVHIVHMFALEKSFQRALSVPEGFFHRKPRHTVEGLGLRPYFAQRGPYALVKDYILSYKPPHYDLCNGC